MSVDGKEVATQNIPSSVPFVFGVDESFDVGSDTGTPEDDRDYQTPFAFNGTLNNLTIKLEPQQMTLADKKTVQDKTGNKD